MKCYRAPYVERRSGSLHGQGLFATEDIEAGSLLAIKNGRIIDECTLRENADVIAGSHQQITPQLFVAGITPEEVDATLVGYNHSCDPNAYVDGQTILRAMKNIPAGAEITGDYATAFSDDVQAFECNCGSPLCRHDIVPSRDSADPELQKKYNGYFAHFLAHPEQYATELVPLDPTCPTTSWLTPKAQRVDSNVHGLGSRALEAIPAGELIAVRGGTLVTKEEAVANQEVMKGSEIQITEDIFFACFSEEERLATMTGFNHSCEPNSYVGGQQSIFALRDIEPGEELSVDYATAYVSPTQIFDCACGTNSCRHVIDTTIDWMNPEIIDRFNGHFADFIQRKITAQGLDR